MSQANFAYGEAGRQSAFSAGVYAAAPASAGPIREAAEAAGFVLVDYELLSELDAVPPPHPADVLVIEVPVQDGATLAALSAPFTACTSLRALTCATRSASARRLRAARAPASENSPAANGTAAAR